MFILNGVCILYPFGVPSAPFDIIVSHRLFSPASRCERCPFLNEVLYWIPNSYTMGCPPVRGDNPRALASGLTYVQVDKHGIQFFCNATYRLDKITNSGKSRDSIFRFVNYINGAYWCINSQI